MEKVAIHENHVSDKVVKFMNLDAFTLNFQRKYEAGHIYGVYLHDSDIVAQDIFGDTLVDIIL